jgi:hypothetical protein
MIREANLTTDKHGSHDQGNAEIAGIGKERQFSPRRHRGTEKSGDRFSILAIPAILAMLGNFF